MKLTTTFWSEKEYTFTNVYFFNNKTKEIIFQTNLNNKRETYNFFKNISKFVLTKQVRFAPEDVGYQIGVMCDSEITPLKWFDLYLDNNLIKHDVACSTILITKNGIDLPFGSFSSKKKKPSKYREFKMESKAYKYLANQVMIPNVAV